MHGTMGIAQHIDVVTSQGHLTGNKIAYFGDSPTGKANDCYLPSPL